MRRGGDGDEFIDLCAKIGWVSDLRRGDLKDLSGCALMQIPDS